MKQTPDSTHVRQATFLGACAALIAACVWAYWPGLYGPFLLDDNASIADLANLGGVTDWHSFKAFVFGGHAGPTGRPLALASFLIDANNWPADPWPFKRTNLLIHVLCGISLAALMHRLLRLLNCDRQTARWCAVVAAGCWLLHPFLVSTTLYVVQRMTQLATLFVFVGMNGYLYGRTFIVATPRKAYTIMSMSIVVFTVLAMLSKENGILLPVLVGVVELTIFADQRHKVATLNRYWVIVFLASPLLIVLLYLGYRTVHGGFFEPAHGRDFSIYERGLTQFRILVDYLRHWFVPELYTTGVFQDHIIKSSGLLSPISTLIAMLLNLALVVSAFVIRRRRPLLAFAVLFFYAAHLLESTVLNLELYFEHRNYLAAAFLFLPLVVWARQSSRTWVFIAVSASALLLLGSFTRYSATIWSDYGSIVRASAAKAPTSARAQQQYALMLFNEQQYDEALRVIARANEARPNSNALLVTEGIIRCQIGKLQPQEFKAIEHAASLNPYDAGLYNAYSSFIRALIDRQCIDRPLEKLRGMFDAMLTVPANADRESLAYSHIQFFIGYVDVRAGKPGKAVESFRRSLQARGGAGHAMFMAALLASENYFEEALLFSNLAQLRLNKNGGGGFTNDLRVRETDILEFEARVRAELQQPVGNEKD